MLWFGLFGNWRRQGDRQGGGNCGRNKMHRMVNQHLAPTIYIARFPTMPLSISCLYLTSYYLIFIVITYICVQLYIHIHIQTIASNSTNNSLALAYVHVVHFFKSGAQFLQENICVCLKLFKSFCIYRLLL